MQKYVCSACGYVYDPEQGDPDSGIKPGTLRSMTLKEYFQNINGNGILSTADLSGKVDAVIYSIPHVFDDGTLAFIMRERLTHLNLQSNPYATFLFIEHQREVIKTNPALA